MSTLAQQYTNSTTAAYLQKGRMAMLKVCTDVLNEAMIEGHEKAFNKRQELAVSVLRDPDFWTPKFVQVTCALDPDLSSDILIIAALGATFTKIAGVTTQD